MRGRIRPRQLHSKRERRHDRHPPCDRREDCAQGQSKGDAAITVSGEGTGTFTFVRSGTAVAVTGTFAGHKFKASLQFTPTQGDCAITAVTSASITGTAYVDIA